MSSMLPGESTLKLQRDGLTLTARHAGPTDAPLVVLLHGFPDTPHTWDAVIPPLVGAGYQVLAPWLRGYTPASAARTARYDLLAVADDIAAWCHALGDPPAHLVGHDWGAFATLVLAKRAPRRWLSVTLLAIPPFGGGFAPAIARYLPAQMLLSSYIPIMASGASPRLLTRSGAGFVRRLWSRWSPGWEFTDAEFAPAAAVFTDRAMAYATTRYYRSLFQVHRAPTRAFHRLLLAAPAPLPTLVLAGLRDGCLSPGLVRVLSEHAGADLVQLPECGHFLQAEKPGEVAAHLLAHLDKHAP
ncbi:alpha/beta fold hydrolase [Nocardia sp. NPDC057668]|uniref:alpha/beta fold hydrolase n=1 Tax=Nocardia sp. NPDC057668 TaxID=3346202 RepID=UPI0036711A45